MESRSVADSPDTGEMASRDDSQTEVRLYHILDPEDSRSDSETAITVSESIPWDAGHSGRDHRAKTARHPQGRPEPGQTERATAARADQADVDVLGLLFDRRIREVSQLQTRRDELIQELLGLREPWVRAVEHLRGRRGEERRRLTLAQWDHEDLLEEVQRVKRRLFSTTRACIQSQVLLGAQEYQVAEADVTQGELQSRIQSLTQEASQLREAQWDQLQALRDQAWRPRRTRASSDVSHCRRASLTLQRRLSGSVKALEGWYEPRLKALLRRAQAGEEALRRSRELGQDLRARLGPLGEDFQRLELQRRFLEERMELKEAEREDRRAEYKESMETLQETAGELQLEFQIQRRSRECLEELKESLLRELNLLRGCDEGSVSRTEEEA